MTEPIIWMSTPSAAEYLGVNTRTVYRLIDEGELPAYKFGRVIRLKEADVVAFIERSRIAPGSLEHLYPEPVRSEG
ncbi:MAG: helix-turn-helix domain-containing protein [Acidimicrobiales bacterium]|jgi:excisionase family DNA binding protein